MSIATVSVTLSIVLQFTEIYADSEKDAMSDSTTTSTTAPSDLPGDTVLKSRVDTIAETAARIAHAESVMFIPMRDSESLRCNWLPSSRARKNSDLVRGPASDLAGNSTGRVSNSRC